MTGARLEELYRHLERWALHTALIPAIVFVRDKQVRLRHAPTREAARWNGVISEQRELVARVAEGLHDMFVQLGHAGVVAEPVTTIHDDVRPPHVLQLYADAAGASHLVALARRALQRAAMSHALLGAAHASALDSVRADRRRYARLGKLAHAVFVRPHLVSAALAVGEASDGQP